MATIVNVTATLENLNMSGTIDGTSTTFSAATSGAIPFDNVGLYQLISEVSTLKATIKTNEKTLIAKLKADSDGTTQLDNSIASRSAINQGTDTGNRGGLTSIPADRPAIIISTTEAKHNLSEDAVFDIFSGITHLIMKLNNDGDVNGAAVNANCTTNT